MGESVLESALLTLTLAVLTPLVALATIALTPFSDRPTQALVTAQYAACVAFSVHLAGVVA